MSIVWLWAWFFHCWRHMAKHYSAKSYCEMNSEENILDIKPISLRMLFTEKIFFLSNWVQGLCMSPFHYLIHVLLQREGLSEGFLCQQNKEEFNNKILITKIIDLAMGWNSPFCSVYTILFCISSRILNIWGKVSLWLSWDVIWIQLCRTWV